MGEFVRKINGFRMFLAISLVAALAVVVHFANGQGGREGDGKPGVSAVPCRIITMAPSITEIAFALGQEHRVVAVSDFCHFPPEAERFPRVGGFVNPNLERITALSPDLVILQGVAEKAARFCKSRGIPVLFVDMDSIPSIFAGIRSMGDRLDCRERAEELIRGIRADLDDVRESISGKRRRKVFICIGREPGGVASLYTTGKNSFVSQLVEAAGGDNIFSDVLIPYPEASKESLLRRAPEVILEIRLGRVLDEDERARLTGEWQVLHGIPAVDNGDVHVLSEDFLLIPGPRVGQATRRFAEVLHGQGGAP
ncbi:MAG: ABC transporter substrate-binding protein [Proteobacteria bacterium]|nr:ABC transporter substrate-binding protein [Pseudomonadota bacterium]